MNKGRQESSVDTEGRPTFLMTHAHIVGPAAMSGVVQWETRKAYSSAQGKEEVGVSPTARPDPALIFNTQVLR